MQTEHLKYTKMNFKDFFSIMIHCNWPKSFAMLIWDIWWTSQVFQASLKTARIYYKVIFQSKVQLI